MFQTQAFKKILNRNFIINNEKTSILKFESFIDNNNYNKYKIIFKNKKEILLNKIDLYFFFLNIEENEIEINNNIIKLGEKNE